MKKTEFPEPHGFWIAGISLALFVLVGGAVVLLVLTGRADSLSSILSEIVPFILLFLLVVFVGAVSSNSRRTSLVNADSSELTGPEYDDSRRIMIEPDQHSTREPSVTLPGEGQRRKDDVVEDSKSE